MAKKSSWKESLTENYGQTKEVESIEHEEASREDDNDS